MLIGGRLFCREKRAGKQKPLPLRFRGPVSHGEIRWQLYSTRLSYDYYALCSRMGDVIARVWPSFIVCIVFSDISGGGSLYISCWQRRRPRTPVRKYATHPRPRYSSSDKTITSVRPVFKTRTWKLFEANTITCIIRCTIVCRVRPESLFRISGTSDNRHTSAMFIIVFTRDRGNVCASGFLDERTGAVVFSHL